MSKNINLTCPINTLGYGYASLNILKALYKQGHNIALWPIGGIEVNPNETHIIGDCFTRRNTYDVNAPSIRIWHQNDLAQHIGRGKKVGFPFFELDRFTDTEKHHLSSQDLILTTSEWGLEVIAGECPKALIGVVPLGVDTSIFFPKSRPEDNKTIFLNVGKWEIRKGHDILIQAFSEAFTENDNVELWMMCHNPFLDPRGNGAGLDGNKEWENYYASQKLGSKVKFLPRVKTHEEVANVMQHVDCGIFPSRAEGWNMEALEMMACGKHVIITDYSAHTEYCNEDNALLVQIEGTETAYDGKWFHGQGEWAKLGKSSMDDLINHMREVHSNLKGKPNKEGILTATQFSWENTANRLIEAIS